MPPAPCKLVVFSGAGLSADSGVPTYRDAGITPCWPGQSPERRTADGRLIMPGTVPEPRTPGLGKAPVE